MDKRLVGLRAELDHIDEELLNLLERRIDVATEIAEVKEAAHLPVTDPQREEQICRAMQERTDHSVLKEHIEELCEMLFSCSKQVRALLRHRSLPFRRIGIVGVGLIGSSIARCIKTGAPSVEVVGVDPALSDAALLADIDAVVSSVEELPGRVDVVVLASPIETVIPLAEVLVDAARHRSDKLVILDVASVKRSIAIRFQALSSKEVVCVATHPMGGSEKSGYQNGRATLFINRNWFVINGPHIPLHTMQEVNDLIDFLGAVPVVVEAEEHDRIVALISHLPGYLAAQYQAFVEEFSPRSVGLAGPGYRSFTRIARSNREMRREIASSNRDQIGFWLERFIEKIGEQWRDSYECGE